MQKKQLKSGVMLTCLVNVSSASVLGIGGVSKSSSSSGKAAATAPAQSLGDVLDTQEVLVRRYITAAASVNEAQIKLAEALDMKEEAAALQDQQKVLTSGAVCQMTWLFATRSSSNF